MSSVAIITSTLLGNFDPPKNTAVITEHKHTFKKQQTSRLFRPSLFFIHVFACVCGSTRRGYRAALVTIMPF